MLLSDKRWSIFRKKNNASGSVWIEKIYNLNQNSCNQVTWECEAWKQTGEAIFLIQIYSAFNAKYNLNETNIDSSIKKVSQSVSGTHHHKLPFYLK